MARDRPESEGNTRRRFLGGALAGFVGPAVGGRVSGEPSNGVETDAERQLVFDCRAVRNVKSHQPDSIRVEFADGSYLSSHNETFDSYGLHGRTIERVFLSRPRNEVPNPDPNCDPGPKVTTFTDTTVTVGGADFTHLNEIHPRVGVTLQFVDGSSQTVFDSSNGPQLGEGGAIQRVAKTYRGRGEHEGKVIEAVHLSLHHFGTQIHIRNQDAAAHLLGKHFANERIVEVVGASEGDVDYEFTVDGPVEKVSLTDRIGAGDNDDITDNGDGTYTVSGFTGNTGYGDAYVINGEITSFTQTGGDGEYVVREHERRVTRRSYDDARLVRVVGTESGDVDYEFTVDGTVYGVTNVGTPLQADDNDDVTDNGDGTWTVDGFTGNQGYGDTYVVVGDVTDFTRTSGSADFEIRVDGREVTESEFVSDY